VIEGPQVRAELVAGYNLSASGRNSAASRLWFFTHKYCESDCLVEEEAFTDASPTSLAAALAEKGTLFWTD
jgi:hypothetical protein